jgi:hypothetical protein
MPQTPEDYNFLNDYIDRIISQSSPADDKPMEDDNNDFFSTSDDEDQTDDDQSNDGISYGLLDDDDFGFHQANADLRESGDPIDDDGNPLSDQGDGGMTPDEEAPDTVYGNGSTGSFFDEPSDKSYITSLNPGSELPGIGNKIAAKESQGKYTAYNSAGGGTGAVGKYQFRWNIWKDSIKTITGVKTQQQFLHSPKAQEKYFEWYKKNYLAPEAQKLQPYNKAGLTKDQLAELVHFRGTVGAKQYLQGKVPNKPEAYNSSISDYLGIKGSRQAGGAVVASSPSAQYHGLNNGSFNSMIFPMHGENTFRGLDDGSPVYLEDETGKKKVLKGRKHKTKMKGHVYETRLNY